MAALFKKILSGVGKWSNQGWACYHQKSVFSRSVQEKDILGRYVHISIGFIGRFPKSFVTLQKQTLPM